MGGSVAVGLHSCHDIAVNKSISPGARSSTPRASRVVCCNNEELIIESADVRTFVQYRVKKKWKKKMRGGNARLSLINSIPIPGRHRSLSDIRGSSGHTAWIFGFLNPGNR